MEQFNASRESFEKLDKTVEGINTGINPEKSTDELLNILSKREQLEIVRKRLINEAHAEAFEEDKKLNDAKNSREMFFSKKISRVLGIMTKENIDAIKKTIRRISLDSNDGLVTKQDENALNQIISLTDSAKKDLEENPSEENLRSLEKSYDKLLTLRNEKELLSSLDSIPDNLTFPSDLDPVVKIRISKTPSGNSINVIVYYIKENGDERWVTLSLGKTGAFHTNEKWPEELRSKDIEKEEIRTELFGNILQTIDLLKMYNIPVLTLMPTGGWEQEDVDNGGDKEPREPEGPEVVDMDRISFYHTQPGLLKQVNSMQGLKDYVSFVFRNGVIFDHMTVNNAIYFFEFTEPLTDFEEKVVVNSKGEDLSMESILRDKGFYGEIRLRKTDRAKKGNRFGQHPSIGSIEAKKRFYGDDGELQNLINKFSAEKLVA